MLSRSFLAPRSAAATVLSRFGGSLGLPLLLSLSLSLGCVGKSAPQAASADCPR